MMRHSLVSTFLLAGLGWSAPAAAERSRPLLGELSVAQVSPGVVDVWTDRHTWRRELSTGNVLRDEPSAARRDIVVPVSGGMWTLKRSGTSGEGHVLSWVPAPLADDAGDAADTAQAPAPVPVRTKVRGHLVKDGDDVVLVETDKLTRFSADAEPVVKAAQGLRGWARVSRGTAWLTDDDLQILEPDGRVRCQAERPYGDGTALTDEGGRWLVTTGEARGSKGWVVWDTNDCNLVGWVAREHRALSGAGIASLGGRQLLVAAGPDGDLTAWGLPGLDVVEDHARPAPEAPVRVFKESPQLRPVAVPDPLTRPDLLPLTAPSVESMTGPRALPLRPGRSTLLVLGRPNLEDFHADPRTVDIAWLPPKSLAREVQDAGQWLSDEAEVRRKARKYFSGLTGYTNAFEAGFVVVDADSPQLRELATGIKGDGAVWIGPTGDRLASGNDRHFADRARRAHAWESGMLGPDEQRASWRVELDGVIRAVPVASGVAIVTTNGLALMSAKGDEDALIPGRVDAGPELGVVVIDGQARDLASLTPIGPPPQDGTAVLMEGRIGWSNAGVLCTWALDTGKLQGCAPDRAPGARGLDDDAIPVATLKRTMMTQDGGVLSATGKRPWRRWGLVPDSLLQIDARHVAVQLDLTENAWSVLDAKGRTKAVLRPTATPTPDRVAAGQGLVIAWKPTEVEVWRIGR